MDHRTGEREPLLLPPAQGTGKLLLSIAEVVLPEQCVDPLHRLRARDVLHRSEELEVLAHGEILEQRELLGHVSDAPAQCLGLLGNPQAQHLDLALAGREQAAQHADRGRLAGTVRAEETVDLRLRHVQVDLVHRDQAAEALGQAAGMDGDVASAGGLCAGALPFAAPGFTA